MTRDCVSRTHRHMAGLLLFLLAASSTAAAEPFIFYRGVFNAASAMPSGLPGGSIARGSIFSIFGREMGPAGGAEVTDFPLGTIFQGVEVKVCQGDVCVSAIPLYVRSDQINAIMPSDAPLGSVSIRVCFNDALSNFTPATVVEHSVGIFAFNTHGYGPGMIQNFVDAGAQPLNSLATTARQGQILIIWATGLGASLNGLDNVPPQVGDLPVEVEIFVGEVKVTNRLYSGRSPQFAGADQIIFEIPAGTPLGCYVPIRIRAGGVVSNTVTVAIQNGAGRCNDGNIFQPLTEAGPFGVIFLQRSDRLVDDPLGPQRQVISDALIATFREETRSDFYFNPLFSPSPPGTCLVFSIRGDLFDRDSLPEIGSLHEIDAGGAITVQTPNGDRIGPRRLAGRPDFYLGVLGGNLPTEADAQALVFDGGGPFVVRGAGGGQVGAFEAQVPAAPKVTWVNRETTKVVNRAQGVTVQFTGGNPAERMLSVWGGAYDQPTHTSTMFACHVNPAANNIKISSDVLANVPAARPIASQSKGWLGLAYEGGGGHVPFAAQGINGGIVLFSGMSARTVVYQ